MAVRIPPGASPLTALRAFRSAGNLAEVPAFLEGMSRRFGPVTSWRTPQGRFWFFDEPALIEELLLANGRDLTKGRGLRRMRRLLGDGLLTSDEPLHLSQRRLVQPAFHRERIARYATAMIDAARDAANALRDGETIPLDALMHRLTLRVAAATLFSANVDDDADAIGAALTEVLEAFPAAVAPFAEILDYLPWHPVTRRFRGARARLDALVFRLIEERRREGVDRGDLLSILLNAVDETGRRMPDRLVRDEALTLLLAGHETTANALAWAWDGLARNPRAEERLHAELDAVLGDRDPTPDDAGRLPFTRDVVAESLRLRPPAWILGRRAVRPVRIGEWEIEPRTTLIASQIVTHRNPAYWREPEAFRPERWSNGETASLPRFAYFPFGGGNRICIGEGFAWTEAVLVLATLARRFRFVLVDRSAVPLDPLVTLRPGRRIRMRVETRASARTV